MKSSLAFSNCTIFLGRGFQKGEEGPNETLFLLEICLSLIRRYIPGSVQKHHFQTLKLNLSIIKLFYSQALYFYRLPEQFIESSTAWHAGSSHFSVSEQIKYWQISSFLI
jgi:hypothetical protein